VDCGPGVDQVEADPLDDVLANCEHVIRHDTAVLGTTTGEEFQTLALDPGPCKVYRWYHSSIGGWNPLRWGNSTFGYRHIRDKHGFRSRRIAYTLTYGRVVESSGTRTVMQETYPGDRYPYRVVFDTTTRSSVCPDRELGIITAYHKTR
jgi:hypothetical protein